MKKADCRTRFSICHRFLCSPASFRTRTQYIRCPPTRPFLSSLSPPTPIRFLFFSFLPSVARYFFEISKSFPGIQHHCFNNHSLLLPPPPSLPPPTLSTGSLLLLKAQRVKSKKKNPRRATDNYVTDIISNVCFYRARYESLSAIFEDCTLLFI